MSQVPMVLYLAVSMSMFFIGAAGVVVRRNPVVVFMCIELMLNAVNLTFLTFARYAPSPLIERADSTWMAGQMMVIVVMAVAAAEVAVGLGIIMAIYRVRANVDVDEMSSMSG